MRPLKKLTRCLAVIWLTLVCGAVAHAQGNRPPPAVPAQAPAADRELTVLNRSKHTVNELYVSPSTADQWGDDKLGDDTLEPGKSTHLRLGRLRDCEFDVQVVYDDASHEESRNFNVCRNRQIAFDGSSAVAPSKTPAGDEHTLTLSNHSARPIDQVFISPADASQWGDDRLGDESISVDDDKEITYHGDCTADLRIVFDNRGAEERRGVNICDTPSISIEPGWTTADTLPTGSAPAPAQTPPAAPTPLKPAPAPPAPTLPAPAPVAPQPPATTERPIPGTVEKGSNPPPRVTPPALNAPAPVTPPPAPRPPVVAPRPPVTPPQTTPIQQPPPATAPSVAPGSVMLINQSGHDAAELYIYPDGSTARGQDRLGADELRAGGTLTVRLNRGATCKFTVHVVYSGSVPDGEMKGVDLCAAQRVVLKP